MPNINLSDYYMPDEAAVVLSKHSGKVITTTYLRQLVVYGKIRRVKINNRLYVYHKKDIDEYLVEEPGMKARRAKKKKFDEKGKKEAA